MRLYAVLSGAGKAFLILRLLNLQGTERGAVASIRDVLAALDAKGVGAKNANEEYPKPLAVSFSIKKLPWNIRVSSCC